MSKHHVSTSGRMVVCTASKKACPRGGHAEMNKEQAKVINNLPPEEKTKVISLLTGKIKQDKPELSKGKEESKSAFRFHESFAEDRQAFLTLKEEFMKAHEEHKENATLQGSSAWEEKRKVEKALEASATKLARTKEGRKEVVRAANYFKDVAERQEAIRDARLAETPAAVFEDDLYPEDWDITLYGNAVELEDSLHRGERYERVANQAKKAGFGEDARPVPVTEVRKALPVGQKLTTTYFLSNHTRSVSKQVVETNSRRMLTQESGTDDQPTIMTWKETLAYKDAKGNYLLTGKNSDFWVGFTPEKE